MSFSFKWNIGTYVNGWYFERICCKNVVAFGFVLKQRIVIMVIFRKMLRLNVIFWGGEIWEIVGFKKANKGKGLTM